MSTLQMKPHGFFKRDEKQARKHFDEQELDRLGDDMLVRGVLIPLLARPDGTIIDGERRWRAAQRKGIKELPVVVTDKPLSEKEVKGIQLATVFHRADLKGGEKWTASAELMGMNPDWQMKDLAEFLHIDPSMVTRLLSPSKCIPAAQEALAAGKIGISDCYEFSKESPDRQAELLKMKLAGASRNAIAQDRRRSRNGSAPAVRMSRVKCMLVSGVCITVAGPGLSLDDLIESLGEAQREAKKAREQGLDSKTFQAVMKDKAKKG